VKTLPSCSVFNSNGEWNMLMLGESLLSLLIVDIAESEDYYATLYSALVTVVLLQYLHFRSMPNHADGHALRRHKNAGIGWSLLQQIYSVALLAIGSAFTLMVLEFGYKDDNHRRFLVGGGGASKYDPEDRRQRTARLFCLSLATVWICLDGMTLFHLGINNSRNRCQCERSRALNIKGIILVLLRVGLVVFMATLSIYETDPQSLAVIGLFCVLLQLILRKLGTKYLSADQRHEVDEAGHNKNAEGSAYMSDSEDLKWPNVTHAEATHSAQHDAGQKH
jgi:hypothetical protein